MNVRMKIPAGNSIKEMTVLFRIGLTGSVKLKTLLLNLRKFMVTKNTVSHSIAYGHI